MRTTCTQHIKGFDVTVKQNTFGDNLLPNPPSEETSSLRRVVASRDRDLSGIKNDAGDGNAQTTRL